ncbi:MAG: diguanylate cyclase [Rhodoferax sp.]|nr:diguanylate cyclase [Rhodoferax sp.]
MDPADPSLITPKARMDARPPPAPQAAPRRRQTLLPASTEASHFHAIIESSDDAIISKTLDGRVTSWNRGAEQVFGYRAEEMLGQSLLLLFPPDRVDEERFIVERLLLGEKVDHFETVRLRKDGSPVHVSVTISPIRDANGHIVGASKIARDITERTRSDARLQLASSVFTHTTEAVAIADRRGRLIEVNQAFSRITGYTRDEVLGHGYRFFKSGNQGPEVLDTLIRQLDLEGHCQGEVWSRRKDGVPYAGLLTISAVRDANARVQSYVALFADTTALRLQQERLEHVAHYDALTDIPNRLLLSDRLHQAMANCQRNHQSLAVLYMDLDGFKAINDAYGHVVGDQLLVAVSARMKAALREVDTLARFGGDEFVVVLVDVQSAQEWLPLVDRVLNACSEPVQINGRTVCVSASVGVTLYPQDGADAATLIGQADRAMYRAKQSGKNRYALFGPEDQAG